MKIIIAGTGKVGTTLARELSTDSNYDVTIIDKNTDALNACCEQYDVLGIEGNCASMQVLKDAGIDKADLLIAVTDADEVNLLCCVTAKNLSPNIHTIARIRNPEYSEQVYDMQDVFGLSLIINPEKTAAGEIERLLKYPGFLKRDSFARGQVEIVELRVDKDSPLLGKAIKDISGIVGRRVLIGAALRGSTLLLPKGDFVAETGDRLFVTASFRDLALLLRNLGIIQHRNKRVMICGGGRISFYLAQGLEKRSIQAQIIEQNRDKCEDLAKLLPDCTVICGNVTDTEVLEKEGLGSCDALVTLTGQDELNVLLSLYGKSRGVPQVITKQSHTDSMTDIVQSLSLGSLIAPKELCCDSIIRYVRSMRDVSGETAITVQTFADGKAQASEFIIHEDSLHRGEQLKDMSIRKDVLIAAISRGRKIEIAGGLSSFDVGDSVIVISGGKDIYRFNDIFE